MRISDWSSDVCSSDLGAASVAHDDVSADDDVAHGAPVGAPHELQGHVAVRRPLRPGCVVDHKVGQLADLEGPDAAVHAHGGGAENGRASCRERGCQYVSIPMVVGSFKKNT